MIFSQTEIIMAKKDKDMKTNVMRLLDQAAIPYSHYCYVDTDAVSGVDVARVMGQAEEKVFKTLVTTAQSGQHYVFVIPVACELNLKKAASACKEKSIEMLKQKDLLPLTGYIHGGCSPIGMKKQFATYFHSSLAELDSVIFSAGKIGYQVEVKPDDLKTILEYELADLIK